GKNRFALIFVNLHRGRECIKASASPSRQEPVRWAQRDVLSAARESPADSRRQTATRTHKRLKNQLAATTPPTSRYRNGLSRLGRSRSVSSAPHEPERIRTAARNLRRVAAMCRLPSAR